MSQNDPVEGAQGLKKATLLRSSIVVGAITTGVLTMTIIAAFIELSTEIRSLMPPAALLGIVSPVIGFRIHLALKRRIPQEAGIEQRCQRFFTATIIPMAVTEGVALFGLIAFMLCREPACLIGVLTHVILAAALWPTPERLELFIG
jgi:hypothetical protein